MLEGILASACAFVGLLLAIVACVAWDARREHERRRRIYEEAQRRNHDP
jgi:hypothetical protein